MKPRTLLALCVLLALSTSLTAQTRPEAVEPAVAVVPAVATAPQAATIARGVGAARGVRAAVAGGVSVGVATTIPAVAPAVPSAVAVSVLPLLEAQAPTAPKPAAAPAAPAAVLAPAAPVPPRPMGQMINVRIDVTLTDSKGAKKTLTMTVADGESGMNRTTSAIPVGQAGGDYSFNADAGPSVVGNKVRLRLTADAVVPVESEKVNGGRLALRQSQTLILSDGESVEIARAADPVSDRVFALSVKATIQR